MFEAATPLPKRMIAAMVAMIKGIAANARATQVDAMSN
jgi:hypothetical protein